MRCSMHGTSMQVHHHARDLLCLPRLCDDDHRLGVVQRVASGDVHRHVRGPRGGS